MSANAAASASPTPVADSGMPFTTPVVDDSKGLELAGGSSPISFDELESATRSVKNKKAQEKKEDREAEGTVEKKPKEQAKKKEDDEGDEEVSQAPKESQKDDKKDTQVAQTEKKTLKLKSGESELDVSADALVTVKVDGKLEKVPLQEVLNRYSQKKHLDEVYEKQKAEKQTFEAERTRLNRVLEKSQEMLVKNQDLEGFLDWIGEAIGQDGATLYRQQIEKFQKELEDYASLTPEEREIRNLKRENERFKARKQAERDEYQKQQEFKKMDAEVSGMLAKEGMTKKDLVKAYDDLVGLGYDAKDFSPEGLISYHKSVKTVESVQSFLGELKPELAQDQDTITQWAQLAIQTKANPEEIRAAMEETYGMEQAKKLARKMSKNERANRSGSQPKNPGKDPMFFDDI